MPKFLNEDAFGKIWNDATAVVKEKGIDREVSILNKAIALCIAQQVSDQGHVRANLSYDADTPSAVTGKTRKELFNSVWASILNQSRISLADACAKVVWGMSFKGIRKLGFLPAYFAAVEKEADSCRFAPDKALKAKIKAKYKKDVDYTIDKSQFVVKMHVMLEIIKDRIGVPPEKHAAFGEKYRAALEKYLGRRAERMTSETAENISGIAWDI